MDEEDPEISSVRDISTHEAAPGPSGIAVCGGCFPVLGDKLGGQKAKGWRGTCSARARPAAQFLCASKAGYSILVSIFVQILLENSWGIPTGSLCGPVCVPALFSGSVVSTPVTLMQNVFGNGPGELQTAPQCPSKGQPRRASVSEGQALHAP